MGGNDTDHAITCPRLATGVLKAKPVLASSSFPNMKRTVTATGLAFSSIKVQHLQRQSIAAPGICLLTAAAEGVHCYTGSQPDAGGEIVEISTDTDEVWLMQGSKEVFMKKISLDSMLKGDLTKSYAHWLVSSPCTWSETLYCLLYVLNKLMHLSRLLFLADRATSSYNRSGQKWPKPFLLTSRTVNKQHDICM